MFVILGSRDQASGTKPKWLSNMSSDDMKLSMWTTHIVCDRLRPCLPPVLHWSNRWLGEIPVGSAGSAQFQRQLATSTTQQYDPTQKRKIQFRGKICCSPASPICWLQPVVGESSRCGAASSGVLSLHHTPPGFVLYIAVVYRCYISRDLTSAVNSQTGAIAPSTLGKTGG